MHREEGAYGKQRFSLRARDRKIRKSKEEKRKVGKTWLK
jgi:hypothetical protein